MMLYIGSDIPLSLMPFRKDAPGFHTETLNEDHHLVLTHFSTKHVLYAGSSEGCGCGFRHALIENEDTWINVMDEDGSDEMETNMKDLYEYTGNIISEGGKVELYACWDGDFKEVAMCKTFIPATELISKEFLLKERGFYTLH